MSDTSKSKNEYQVLLDAVRQNYASAVWTHKIQIKQADIYAVQYRYNGPIISDHSSKNYREHGKIQQESEKETTP